MLTLSDYLAERDAVDAASYLLDAGIERTADLLQLSASDLANLGVPAELQYKLFGVADHPIEVNDLDETERAGGGFGSTGL